MSIKLPLTPLPVSDDLVVQSSVHETVRVLAAGTSNLTKVAKASMGPAEIFRTVAWERAAVVESVKALDTLVNFGQASKIFAAPNSLGENMATQPGAIFKAEQVNLGILKPPIPPKELTSTITAFLEQPKHSATIFGDPNKVVGQYGGFTIGAASASQRTLPAFRKPQDFLAPLKSTAFTLGDRGIEFNQASRDYIKSAVSVGAPTQMYAKNGGFGSLLEKPDLTSIGSSLKAPTTVLGALRPTAIQSQALTFTRGGSFEVQAVTAGLANSFLRITPLVENSVERLGIYAKTLRESFYVPEATAVSKLLEAYRPTPITTLAGWAQRPEIGQQFLSSIQTPWLDRTLETQSLASYLELQGIGTALKIGQPFGGAFPKALRGDLGDWRDPITWESVTVATPAARTEFYFDQGLKPALIDFPEEAFEVGLEKAGLVDDLPPLEEMFGLPMAFAGDADEEIGLALSRKGFELLQRLETQLRRFIDHRMRQVAGENWARKRLPNNMYEDWEGKKAGAEASGLPVRPLIAYADFSEYTQIIGRKDNWREAFAPVFGRIEDIRESLQRLGPLRNATMHARPLGQADLLYLFVEARRIMVAISTAPGPL